MCTSTTVLQGAAFHHLRHCCDKPFGYYSLGCNLLYNFSTIWYELQVGEWPLTNQPVEAKIWLFGGSEGIKQVLAAANVGKEITVVTLVSTA